MASRVESRPLPATREGRAPPIWAGLALAVAAVACAKLPAGSKGSGAESPVERPGEDPAAGSAELSSTDPAPPPGASVDVDGPGSASSQAEQLRPPDETAAPAGVFERLFEGDRSPPVPDPDGPDALDAAEAEWLARDTVDPEAGSDTITVRSSVVRDALPASERSSTLDELDDRIEGDQITLRGVYLDPERTRFLAVIRYGAVGALYLVLSDSGRPLLRLRVERRNMPYLRDVAEDAQLELILSVVHGQALSTYPRSWQIYDLTGSKARRIAEFPHSFSQGAKYSTWGFFNLVTFPEHGKIRVETKFLAEDLDPELRARFPPGAPTREGEVVEYDYDAKRRRFEARASKAPPEASAAEDARED